MFGQTLFNGFAHSLHCPLTHLSRTGARASSSARSASSPFRSQKPEPHVVEGPGLGQQSRARMDYIDLLVHGSQDLYVSLVSSGRFDGLKARVVPVFYSA